MLRLFIDMIEDKYPYYWRQADNDGTYTVDRQKPTVKVLTQLIIENFNSECTELDVKKARGKHKRRARILKTLPPDPQDALEMINYYKASDEIIHPKRRGLLSRKGMKSTTLEILQHLIAKGEIYVK